MISRHAAALALVGWYLMLPPMTGTGAEWTVDINAPIAKWEQSGAYDTAQSCEDDWKKGRTGRKVWSTRAFVVSRPTQRRTLHRQR